MLDLAGRIEVLETFGNELSRDIEAIENGESNSLSEVIQAAKVNNGWFSEEFTLHALKEWSTALQKDGLEDWMSNYDGLNHSSPKAIGLVLAGNIPLVGMHDIISTFITGHRAIIKPSSQDLPLTMEVLRRFKGLDSIPADAFTIQPAKLQGFDAVIATGSGNTARYFNHYFGSYPSIIRKNRTSVAVLSGEETREELSLLMDDVFTYFGLGCRNVTKVFLPTDFEPDRLFQASLKYERLLDNNKYVNNFLYHKTLLAMQQSSILENGLFTLCESRELFSAVSVLNYSRYEKQEVLDQEISAKLDDIQCVVGRGNTEFGKAQKPRLMDYSDGKDTVDFLLSLAV